ncbi:MAG: hypothetical protein M3A44_11745 [Gammaproteobacteria bacterium]
MPVFRYFLIALVLGLMGSLTACGGGSGAGADNGGAPSVAVNRSVIAVNDPTCPNGGILVETGIDKNINGVLDANEVTKSEAVCNGANGVNTLITQSIEPAGSHCLNGGVRLDSGMDTNHNGTLDSAEISSSSYVCNGGGVSSSSPAVLVASTSEPPGSNCLAGGSKIEAGLDLNSSGALDPREITSTTYACLPHEAGIVENMKIHALGAGDFIAVWTQQNGTGADLWASRYRVGPGWDIPGMLQNGAENRLSSVDLAVNGKGSAVVTWREYIRKNGSISYKARYYTAAGGWQAASTINTVDLSSVSWGPNVDKVVMDASGNVTVMSGVATFSGTNSIWARRYQPGTGWNPLQSIANLGADFNIYEALPRAITDSAGNVMMTWASAGEIWSERYLVASGWDGPHSLGVPCVSSGGVSSHGLDRFGNVLAACVSTGIDGVTKLSANRYAPGKGWGIAGDMDALDINLEIGVSFAMDPAGNAIIYWIGTDGIKSNRYNVTLGWETPQLLGPHVFWSGSNKLAFNSGGNVIALWADTGGTVLHASQSTSGSAWQASNISGAIPSVSSAISSERGYDVAIDDASNAVAIWSQFDGTRRNFWFNTFIPGTGWASPQLVIP